MKNRLRMRLDTAIVFVKDGTGRFGVADYGKTPPRAIAYQTNAELAVNTSAYALAIQRQAAARSQESQAVVRQRPVLTVVPSQN